MNTDDTPEFAFADGTTAFGDALLNAPALRAWPPSLDEAREILAGQPYEVIERIGYGGMGAVFRVRNLEPGIDRPEAVKIRRPEARDDERFRERFLRESATLAQLRHPGLTTVFRSGESVAGYLWFSMEYLEGKSLADLTAPRQPPLAPERVLDITRQLCTTLQFIHEKGRLHRDLKPANVMVCDDGSVRLLDFGIASGIFAERGLTATGREASTNRHLTHPGESPHTPDFAAPEQINGGETDARTDLYGFGRIVHAMIHPPGASPVRPGCYPQRLLDLVDDLLAFDRGDRPASAAAVVIKLGQVEPGTPGFWGRDHNPFRGLANYQPEHSEIFFGRDAAIRRGLELLLSRTASRWHGFLLITGASGSGKSSLARAGLGPALLCDSQPGTDAKPAAPVVCDLGTIRPEHDCLLPSLARALAAGLSADPAAFLETLQDANADLARFLPSALEQSVTCCLILDQFEQFFRTELPRAAQIRFVDAIARLATTPGVVVLVTLRSDCYYLCQSQSQFMELKDGRHLDLPPPQPWEIATLLRLSARAADLTFETAPDGRGLDDILLEHARRNPQALPLLSYLLDQLWEQRDPATNTLRYVTYEALGGFEGAIAEKARATCRTFAEDYPGEAQITFDALFHLLVEAHDTACGISFARRRAAAEELAAASAAIRTLAERLVSARLLVQDESGLALAHDALLSPAVVARWETLGHWLESSTRDLIIRDRVTQRCQDWIHHARTAELLLPAGSLLFEAETLLNSKPALFPADQREFIHQAATTARETARRSTRRRRLAFSSLAALTTLAVSAALWAVRRERETSQARQFAENAKIKAQTQEQAATRARGTAEGLIDSMLYDLRDKLVTLGRTDLLDDVSKQAEDYFKNNPSTSPAALRNEGTMWLNQANQCAAKGDLLTARKCTLKGLKIKELLAKDQPDDILAQLDLGVCHALLGQIARSEGDLKASRQCFEDSLTIHKRLVETFPNDARVQLALSANYGELGCGTKAEGDLKTALEMFEKSQDINLNITASARYLAQAQRQSRISYENLGDIAQAEGNLPAARKAFESSLEIDQLHATTDPHDAVVQLSLGNSYERLGKISIAEGNLRAAREAVQKGLEIRQRLAAADPRDTVIQKALSASYARLSSIANAEGNLKAARSTIEKCQEIDQHIAASNPRDATHQRNLGITYANLARIALAMHDFKSAREAVMNGLEVRQRLADAYPLNAIAQHDLCDSYNLRGCLAQTEGDLKAGREAFEKCVKIIQPLAAADPRNVEIQGNLSLYHFNRGIIAKAEGDLDTARMAFEKCLDISQELVATAPRNAEPRQKLAASHVHLSELASSGKNSALCTTHRLACLTVLQDMDKAGMKLDSQLQIIYAELKTEFGKK